MNNSSFQPLGNKVNSYCTDKNKMDSSNNFAVVPLSDTS